MTPPIRILKPGKPIERRGGEGRGGGETGGADEEKLTEWGWKRKHKSRADEENQNEGRITLNRHNCKGM